MSDEEKTPATQAHQRRADAPSEGAWLATDKHVIRAIRRGYRTRGDIARSLHLYGLLDGLLSSDGETAESCWKWVDGALRRLRSAGLIEHKDRGWEVTR